MHLRLGPCFAFACFLAWGISRIIVGEMSMASDTVCWKYIEQFYFAENFLVCVVLTMTHGVSFSILTIKAKDGQICSEDGLS